MPIYARVGMHLLFYGSWQVRNSLQRLSSPVTWAEIYCPITIADSSSSLEFYPYPPERRVHPTYAHLVPVNTRFSLT